MAVSYEITAYRETVAHQGSTEESFTYLCAWGVTQQDSAGLYRMCFRLYDAARSNLTAKLLGSDGGTLAGNDGASLQNQCAGNQPMEMLQ